MHFFFVNDFEWYWMAAVSAGLVVCLLNLRLSRWMAWATLGIGIVFLTRFQLLYFAYVTKGGTMMSYEYEHTIYFSELIAPAGWLVLFVCLAGAHFDVRRRLTNYEDALKARIDSALAPESGGSSEQISAGK